MRIVDAPGAGRYEARGDDGTLLGFAAYTAQPRRLVFTHTEVYARGQGTGTELVARALDDVRERELQVVPECSFVTAFLEQHPDYDDLVGGY